MGKEIIIGRNGNQQITIDDPTVSRQHCRVTPNGDGTYLVENLSAAGTMVDGVNIIRTTATKSSQIRLGKYFTANLADLMGTTKTPVAPPRAATTPTEEVSIASLRHVYDNYCEQKIELQKQEKKSQGAKMIPSLCFMALSALSLILPDNSVMNTIKVVVGIVAIAFVAYSFISMRQSAEETPEKLAEIDKNFKVKNVCPKCGNFLGYVPFESLQSMGRCNYCKTKWKL